MKYYSIICFFFLLRIFWKEYVKSSLLGLMQTTSLPLSNILERIMLRILLWVLCKQPLLLCVYVCVPGGGVVCWCKIVNCPSEIHICNHQCDFVTALTFLQLIEMLGLQCLNSLGSFQITRGLNCLPWSLLLGIFYGKDFDTSRKKKNHALLSQIFTMHAALQQLKSKRKRERSLFKSYWQLGLWL